MRQVKERSETKKIRDEYIDMGTIENIR